MIKIDVDREKLKIDAEGGATLLTAEMCFALEMFVRHIDKENEHKAKTMLTLIYQMVLEELKE
jgi:hypothetical protein